MENFTADGSALTRSSDHGNCTWFEEKLQRVYGSYRLPAFELLASFFGKRRRKNHLKLSSTGVDLDWKSRCAEHVQHRVICSNHFSRKNFDPICCGYVRQLAEQDAAEAASLKIVCDREGDLGPCLRDGDIERVAHYTVLVATERNQSKSLVQVRFSVSFGSQGGAILKAVKPQPT
jgi:hypothetical protein